MVIVSCDPYMKIPAHEFIPWLRKQESCRAVPVILLADPEESEQDPEAMSAVLNAAMACGNCLSLTPPVEMGSFKQIIQALMMANNGTSQRKSYTPKPQATPAAPTTRSFSVRGGSRPQSARTMATFGAMP